MWEQQTLLSEVAPVKASLSQARGKDSQELPDSCSNTFERYVNSVHVGLSGRTSQSVHKRAGEAYRQLLSEMDALGYGLAWRVLDAQFFGVAQRRERVFLVGSLGTMRCAEVLLSAKACRGIISRADRRGKPLPKRLRDALEKQIMILAA